MLSVENLHKSYQVGRTTYEVLKGASFKIDSGEFVAVMGPSGSGKTTMLNCISSYIPYEKGKIKLGNIQMDSLSEEQLADLRNRKLGFVFQDFMLLDGLTIKENIMLPRMIAGKTDHGMIDTAERLCQIFGITAIKNKYPAEVSGGERQRTAVARALVNNPLMILADEPTGNLDSKSSAAVIQSFKRAQKELNATIFMVTHDSFAAAHCDRVIIMNDGVVNNILQNHGNISQFQDELLAAIKAMSEEVTA
ncbi:ABC-type lipoprotein export system ATPase subunit [Enterococcus sp. PF1-24]|uniref:ABC transporter ATP-binding protein n=1 Tax=unclassified Enterococcus TaxID=2608891 RepID=UPI00247661E3|nr:MULTISPECIES: ABC transporter ATP-binding protein [unclassified Enterococcus]MDH6363308.1 ABC-type lipoprotein export system ATPase subunit [Enterococcus sp. PFB1-1]MDH6400391.1 ABC-type lipoprotein export system ATPase subunit [Enterococcus sp. PF1-24]